MAWDLTQHLWRLENDRCHLLDFPGDHENTDRAVAASASVASVQPDQEGCVADREVEAAGAAVVEGKILAAAL